jgi:hypothetical protein
MQGKRLHAALAGSVLEAEVIIVNALLTMYGRCEMAESAQMVFDEAPKLDVVTWNGMLASYANKLEALQVRSRMLLTGITPDRVTYVSLASVCASQTLLVEGKRMHARILAGAASKYDVNLGNALISMYAKCGCASDASIVFENMQERDVVSWNAIIAAYAFCGLGYEAIGLYDRMRRFLAPNKVTYLVVLSACSHAGLLEEAFFYCSTMTQHCGVKPAEEHYNCIVELLGRSGLVDEGERIIDLSPSLCNNALAWATLVGFCRVHCDEACGERAAMNALHLEPGNSSLYVLLSNIYASSSSSSSSSSS